MTAALPGTSIIYEPKTEALEYAPLAVNLYRGCGHGCAYCYVPGAIHMKRVDFDAGVSGLKRNYFARLRKEAQKYQAAGIVEQVLLSFTSDPYHPGDTLPTRQTLEILREHRLGFCTLTKGGTRAVRDLDLFRPDRDAFATTLTSLDDNFSLKWERNAPLPGDRIAATKAFYDAGIFTWSSLEPTLDIEASLAIIRATYPFVDLYKIGKANNCGALTKTTDWCNYTLRVIDLLGHYGKAGYIKKSLQMYLPEGYPNPMRVPQFHPGASDQ
jgi:hypothetical protein